MTRRFTDRLLATLACLLFAMQALAAVPSILAAADGPHAAMTSEHCGGMSAPVAKTKHCPHCQDIATASSGCATHCAVALPTAALLLLATPATVESPQSAEPLLSTRSDIPPTPPPIR